MLQIPSKKNNATFRKAFIPRDGNLFIVADYSQIELRIMAELSGDEAMLHAFKEKLDLHTYTASLMFKTPLGEVTDRQRSTAKTVNFGILYGMGPKKLRETLINDGIDMSMDEAVESVKQWKKSYLRAAGQIVNWQMSVLQLGYTATPFGRKRFFDITTEDKYERFGIQRAGANHVIQGTSADITKLAMLLIHSSLEGLPGVIVLQVYDEIVVEVPEYLAEWAKDMVQSCMHVAAEEVLNTVPCQVDAVISRSWSEEDEV
jgi:DNA polymerase-1